MGTIDKKKVKRSFNRQADEYDRHADVQKRVVARFLEILCKRVKEPRRVLDVGTGTGLLLSGLKEVFPAASLFGIDLAFDMSRAARAKMPEEISANFLSADAEHLPFADGAFDLVISTSTFQWLNTLDSAFKESFRVLDPGGIFCFSLFGESTLHELKKSYRRALATCGKLGEDNTHAFRTAREVEDSLVQAGFESCIAVSEQYLEYHENVPLLLRSLKNVGAGNTAPVHGRGLSGRKIMQEMIAAYAKEFRKRGLIPATYEVVYAIGKKPCGKARD